jgi:hypothetical protein
MEKSARRFTKAQVFAAPGVTHLGNFATLLTSSPLTTELAAGRSPTSSPLAALTALHQLPLALLWINTTIGELSRCCVEGVRALLDCTVSRAGSHRENGFGDCDEIEPISSARQGCEQVGRRGKAVRGAHQALADLQSFLGGHASQHGRVATSTCWHHLKHRPRIFFLKFKQLVLILDSTTAWVRTWPPSDKASALQQHLVPADQLRVRQRSSSAQPSLTKLATASAPGPHGKRTLGGCIAIPRLFFFSFLRCRC